MGVAEGIAIGSAFIFINEEPVIDKRFSEDLTQEIKKLHDALDIAEKEINALREDSLQSGLHDEAEILEAHKQLLKDPEIKSSIERKISDDHLTASWAIDMVAKEFITLFESMENEYMRARALDIKDIFLRLQRHVLNITAVDISSMKNRSIIIAEDLTPSDTMRLDKRKIAGFILEKGGRTSHTAILAKAMEIPAIFGVGSLLSDIETGDLVCMNGETGEFSINPNEVEITRFKEMQVMIENKKGLLTRLIGMETKSKEGYLIKTEANIGSLEDLGKAIENDAEGIGLFRSEFLFMNRSNLPSEEEQFEVYKEVAQRLNGKPVIIRTLDVGGDKNIPYLNIPKESNPFLGFRAIRFCLKEVEIFKPQLRALLRASAFGNVKIMFPMISSLEELMEAKELLEHVKNDLRKQSVKFNENIEVGIMIEIPAAAIISDALAKEADFFSIGTNDLIQYCVAVDRMNDKIANLYTPYHPAVLRLIKMTIDNGHQTGIKVGMCGQMASIPELVPILLGMGIDEFSTPPSSILKNRNILNGVSKIEMMKIAEELMLLPTATEVEKKVNQLYSDHALLLAK
jgi:phosphoenolpyruvate-protein phosphotransferase (PTS system enzyme I)